MNLTIENVLQLAYGLNTYQDICKQVLELDQTNQQAKAGCITQVQSKAGQNTFNLSMKPIESKLKQTKILDNSLITQAYNLAVEKSGNSICSPKTAAGFENQLTHLSKQDLKNV